MGPKDKDGWIEDVVAQVRKCIKTRRYRITKHAQERQEQYKISLPELFFALKNGIHEKEKTLFDNVSQSWKYAIKGKTLDTSTDLRIIVAFEDEMAIITVIRLDKKRRKNE